MTSSRIQKKKIFKKRLSPVKESVQPIDATEGAKKSKSIHTTENKEHS